jgi:hypothetical protein
MVLVSSRNCAFIFCSPIHMGVLDGTLIWLPITTSKSRPKMDEFPEGKILSPRLFLAIKKSGETRSIIFQHGF